MAARGWCVGAYRKSVRWVALVLLVAPVGCSRPSEPADAGPGGRPQPLALKPQQELAAGRQAAQQVREKYAGRFLPADSPEVRRVRDVTERLVRASQIEPLQREMNLRVRNYVFEWEANVVRDREINAFCLPAGKIFVLTGILGVTGEDDDFLATVLAHEMAHALAHHASERVAREQTSSNVLRNLYYDRIQEAEADHIGVFLMALAGYDPNRAVAFWQRMSQAGAGRGVPEFLSDHPSDETRIHNLQEWAPRAQAAKKAFDEGRIAPPR